MEVELHNAQPSEHRLNPPLKKSTDNVLNKWYFHHYENKDDMPFGHDIADPAG
jgi:hypothetical protein